MASLVAYVKGDPVTKTLGDCPFSHRVLLTLETKHVTYDKDFVDFDNKPEWLQEKSGGKVPVINDGDFWLPDSDEIIKFLEEKFPEPSMVSHVPAEVGAKFFGAFRGLLLSSPEEEAEKRAAFGEELYKVEAYLASQPGPLFGGETLNATDAAFAPKLYHAITTLQYFKGYSLLDASAKFPALTRYWKAISATDTWKRTDCGTEQIIKGWSRVVNAPK